MRKSILSLLFFTASLQLSAVSPIIGGYNVYFGSLHNHTANSDGQGTLDQAYSYAKNNAGYDFFAVSDHDNYPNAMTVAEYNATITTANTYNEDGVFTTFWGYEWGSNSIDGEEITIINAPTFVSSTNTAYNNWDKIGTWIDAQDCIAFFNHLGYAKGNGKATHTNNYARTVRNNIVGMETFNKTVGYATYWINNGEVANDGKNYFQEALASKWKIGAMGGNDNHTQNWGTNSDFRMAVLAQTKSRADIYGAIKARRFYSTIDKNIALSFKINNQEMGSTVTPGTYTFQVQATDGNGESFSEVIIYDKNQSIKQSWTPNAANVNVNVSFTVANGDYYYVKVKEADGNEAISSPIWVSDASTYTAPLSVNEISYSISNKILTLKTDNGFNVEIFNTQGKAVFTVKNSKSVSLGDLGTGIYIAKLYNKTESIKILRFSL